MTDLASADFTFLGRSADSLLFSVTNPAVPSPPPVLGDTSPPGFRYELASDEAIVLPEVTAPAASTLTYPGNLPAYPFFVFDTPGTHIIPLSPFGPSIAVATALRSRCRFEPALEWYRLAFDPLTSDCAWVHCEQTTPVPPPPPPPPPPPAPATPPTTATTPPPPPKEPKVVSQDSQSPSLRSGPAAQDVVIPPDPSNGACCDSTDVSCATAETARSFFIISNAFGIMAMRSCGVIRRKPSSTPRLIFDTARLILGKQPCNVPCRNRRLRRRWVVSSRASPR